MKRPKSLPTVERNVTISASAAKSAGVVASTLVGKKPSPACRGIAGYGCR